MLRRITVVLGMALLAGCQLLQPQSTERPRDALGLDPVQSSQLAGHFAALQNIARGLPVAQTEALAAARLAYEQAPQGSTGLRYALLLATPGHAGHDAPLAQRLLHEQLARPELLSPIESTLAQVELARVDRELGLVADNERLAADALREQERARSAAANPQMANRVQNLAEENARLRRELDVALAKLEAIANIERSISEPAPAPTKERQP
jgi:hypothetical protein